jgi:hypothetical protein
MLFLNVPESTGEIHEDHSQENWCPCRDSSRASPEKKSSVTARGTRLVCLL